MRWTFEGRHFWLPIFAPFVVWVLVSLAFSCREQQIRLTGMFLQLLGVVTVALRLWAAQRQFPGQTLAQWLQRRPRFRVQHQVLAAAAISVGADIMTARGRVGPGPQSTLADRVAMLESSYTHLFDEVGALGGELRKRTDEFSSGLRTETAAREQGDRRTEEQLRRMAVGALHLDFWGVLYFLFGIVGGTASAEIATLLGAASCK